MIADSGRLVHHLVGINSANPKTCQDGAGEAKMAAYCAQWLRQAGVSAQVVEAGAGSGRPAVIANIGRQRVGHASLLLSGHLDTYTWYTPPGVEADGARMHGPGAADMKGGIAAILLTLAELAHRREAVAVKALLVPDEEHASLGMRTLAPGIVADACIVLEDTELEIGTRQAGRVRATVSTSPTERGRLLLKMLLALRRHALSGAAPLRVAVDSLTPNGVVLEQRVAPGENAHEIAREIGVTLADLCTNAVHWDVREALLASADEPIVEVLTAAALRNGCASRMRDISGWTEAGVIAAIGVPTVVFGPGGGGAHTRNEWVSINQVDDAVRVLTDAVIAFCVHPRALRQASRRDFSKQALNYSPDGAN